MLSRFVQRCRQLTVRILRSLAWRLDRAAEIAQPSLPSWVESELRALAYIEPELLTPEGTTSKYQYYNVPSVPAPGEAYLRLLDAIGCDEPTQVVLVPWLKPGGADRGALYHVTALVGSSSPGRTVVIGTERAESPWKERLPEGVTFVDFGLIADGLDFILQVQVLTRLLVQMQPRLIHIINSRHAWEAVKISGLAIRQSAVIYASLFCDDYRQDGTPVGYARDYLRSCYVHLSAAFCDNSVYPSIWANELGVPAELFTVLPFPYDRPIEDFVRLDDPTEQRVLWAGRLDRQKRPDILAEIAARMPEIEFDVHGSAVIGPNDPAIERLRALPNVTLHGAFQRLEEVVRPSHIAYLHTAQWEGLPTVLFDVAAAGVPICAPAVGGIPDFIDARFLVSPFDNVEEFVAQLRKLADSRNERAIRRQRQYDTLRRDRSWSAFVGRLEDVPGYLEPTPQSGADTTRH